MTLIGDSQSFSVEGGEEDRNVRQGRGRIWCLRVGKAKAGGQKGTVYTSI